MKILFQGDSITDCGRDRDDITSLGSGYPKYVANYLAESYPQIKFEFVNKGISADETCHLVNRWQEDAIDINPDLISILVGVNDTWHFLEGNPLVPNEVFEANYRKLLTDIKENTDAKIIILEPYVLDFPGNEEFHNDLDEKIRIIRKLAREYADAYVPLDGLFASACVLHAPNYWTIEGVHPTEAGHELIAGYYFNAIADIIESNIELYEDK